jgi:hypothetical protein
MRRVVCFEIAVFANLFKLISKTPAADADTSFVNKVNALTKPVRDPKIERFILICWGLIAIKHVAIIYACYHWPVPFHQLWINAPTFAMGLLATAIYYVRR